MMLAAAPPSSHQFAIRERHSCIALKADDGTDAPRTRKRDRVRKALTNIFTRRKAMVPDVPAVTSLYDSGFRLSQPQDVAVQPQEIAPESTVASSNDSGSEQASLDCSSAALIESAYDKFDGELQEEERAWLTPEIASVYVTRRTAPADQLQMLSDTLEWRIRRREILATRECAACAQNPRSHDAVSLASTATTTSSS